MSFVFLGERDVLIRKRCRCAGCLLWYGPGTRIRKIVQKIYGEFAVTCLCPTCVAVIKESPDCYDEYGDGEVRDDPDWEAIRVGHGYPMGDDNK
jgi:hypothetical protein